jgi:hypothetical protein
MFFIPIYINNSMNLKWELSLINFNLFYLRKTIKLLSMSPILKKYPCPASIILLIVFFLLIVSNSNVPN